jgi:hypothetical protein
MSDFYKNVPISKDRPEVFVPANRCIYCPDSKPPFTREHVIPRGMGGGMILPKASCAKCQEIIKEIETYCMRGPFLSHRLGRGLVNYLKDLGNNIRMPIIIDGKRHEKEFPTSQYPHFLILPRFAEPPRMLTDGVAEQIRVASFSLWGVEEELRALHAEGNAILVENYDVDKFGRALAKMAHGYIAGLLRLENFEPLLPTYILGEAPQRAGLLIGDWPEDYMAKPSGVLHQIGHAFADWGARVLVQVRIRLFAEHQYTPIYRVLVGFLTKPLDEVLAPLGLRSVPPSA